VAIGAPGDDGARDADARIVALEAALARSEARAAAGDAKAAASDARIVELVEQVSRLVAQIEILTEKLGKNSSNSHLPPSSDGPGAASRGGSAKR
jgi:hypothetical protein